MARTRGHSSDQPASAPRGGNTPANVWLRDAPPPRNRRNLTRESIVTTAAALLDEQGIERLTMRRLAERLDVTSTALYWHVNTKEEVLDLAFDHIFGTVEIPQVGRDWHGDVRTLLREWRATMLAHPWTTALVGRPMLGPNVLARTEFLYATLARTGLTGLDLAAATQLLANYVIGTAAAEATWHRAENNPSDQALGRKRIEDNRASYPTLYEAGHLDEHRANSDKLFERGLDMLITSVIGPAENAQRPTFRT